MQGAMINRVAYLNYIFFDEIDGFDDVNQGDNAGWKAVPATAYFNKALVKFDDPIVIEKPGYIYIYLSYENESNNFVYFDDLKVNYQKSQIVQSNNYYAFGLMTSDSWTRIDTKPNQYLYNAGSELNDNTNWYETFFREYDPVLGRFSGVDPHTDFYASHTPYNYGFNDPVYYNDPLGADASDPGHGFSWWTWKDDGPQDAHAGPGSDGGMYGSSWNYYTYGSSSVGGSAFATYGPGDGGALQHSMDWIYEIKKRIAEGQQRRDHLDKLYGQAWAMTPEGQNGTFLINGGEIIHWITYVLIGRDFDIDPSLIASTRALISDLPGELRLLAIYSLVRPGTNTGDFKILGGQHMRVELMNMNIIGVHVGLEDRSTYTFKRNWLGIKMKVFTGDSYNVILAPGQTKEFDFYRHNYAPMPWLFSLDTISDAANVGIKIYSNWIPGDPIDNPGMKILGK
jgi:RHS repeat-associated protein